MAIQPNSSKFVQTLIKSLGLDPNKVKGVTLRIYAGEVVTAECEMLVDEPTEEQVFELRRFRLIREEIVDEGE